MLPSLPGFPSIHGILEAIANGFFGALASALVPGFLKHAGVATVQALVALPDPASWPHVSQLQGEMTFLGVLLLPVTLAAGTLRYWLVGPDRRPEPGGSCRAVRHRRAGCSSPTGGWSSRSSRRRTR